MALARLKDAWRERSVVRPHDPADRRTPGRAWVRLDAFAVRPQVVDGDLRSCAAVPLLFGAGGLSGGGDLPGGAAGLWDGVTFTAPDTGRYRVLAQAVSADPGGTRANLDGIRLFLHVDGGSDAEPARPASPSPRTHVTSAGSGQLYGRRVHTLAETVILTAGSRLRILACSETPYKTPSVTTDGSTFLRIVRVAEVARSAGGPVSG